jgi:glycosyltransferase involved in cell wall biosynthesis
MRPIIIHHHNDLSMGGTQKMCQIMMKHFVKDTTFNHVLAYKVQGDRTREIYFREIMGQNKLAAYSSIPEFVAIINKVKPFIIHRYSAGIPEFPFIPAVSQHTDHFVSTSVFGNQDDTIPISKVIFVSKHIQHLANRFGDKYEVVRNAVEDKVTDENLRKDLKIDGDTIVFGHIGRPDDNTFDNLNLMAYKEIEDENTMFLWLPDHENARNAAKDIGIKNIIFLPRTMDDTELGKFYNTINVLAHSRKDGECNPAVMFEAFAYSVPVISHYGMPFNGHVECIADAGFVVPPGDIKEYARIMERFKNKTIDYYNLMINARKRYDEWGRDKKWAQKQLNIYKGLLNG